MKKTLMAILWASISVLSLSSATTHAEPGEPGFNVQEYDELIATNLFGTMAAHVVTIDGNLTSYEVSFTSFRGDVATITERRSAIFINTPTGNFKVKK